MAKKNADLKFRLKKLMKQENLSDEIKHNNLMTEKHKKVRRASNYFEHSLFFISAVTGWVSISSAYTSLSKFTWKKKHANTVYSLLGYKIDLNFHDYKLATEIDENGHSYRDIDYKMKKQKALDKNLVASLLELILTKKS